MTKPCVYMMTNKPNGTLYVGVTSDLPKRVAQHKAGDMEGFTKRYGLHMLVWFEVHESMEQAILRETTIKAWKRVWKLQAIAALNSEWKDLYASLF
ncbi:GIY-YIG nuclease family protein [bacterium]|nr:GIY-YIG nuclease family protein [bacterium]